MVNNLTPAAYPYPPERVGGGRSGPSRCFEAPPKAPTLALYTGVCHKGGVKRLRDFGSLAAFFGEREIDELQASIDARREARAARGDTSRDGSPTQADPAVTPEGGRCAS